MATKLGSIEVRMSDEDRERLGGDEWVRLDLDKLWSTPSLQLERWEAQIGDNRSIATAVALAAIRGSAPAWAKRCVLWVARKQSGDNRNNASGTAEPYAALADVQAMQIRIRDHVDPDAPPPVEDEEADQVDPPEPEQLEPSTPTT